MSKLTRWVFGLIAAAGCAAGVTLTAPDAVAVAAKRRAACSVEGTTLAADGRVRVYQTGRRDEHRYYLCWLPAGKRHFLFEDPELNRDPTGGMRFTVAGRWAAISVVDCDVDLCGASVLLVDGRTGKIVRFSKSVTGGVGGLSVNRDGEILWSAGLDPVHRSGGNTIMVLTATQDAEVAIGPDIDPKSLATRETPATGRKAVCRTPYH